MDQYGRLPSTLEELSERLERGEVLTIAGSSDSFGYALFLDGEKRVILRQGSQEQPFKQLEVAVLTLLCCLGEFSSTKNVVALDPAESDHVDDRVRDIIADLFSVDKAKVSFNTSLSDDLKASNWGFDDMELAARLEDAFHISIDLLEDGAESEWWKTVGDIQKYLQSRGVL